MPSTPTFPDGVKPMSFTGGAHYSRVTMPGRTPTSGSGTGSTIPPEFGNWDFSNGTVGIAYLHGFDLPDADQPITYSINSGTLPPGLSLVPDVDNHSAAISGTPTTAGSYSFNLRAANNAGHDDQAFSIDISSAGGGAFTFVT